MGYSILDVASTTRQQALQGMEDVANQEQQREAANKQLEQAQKAQTMSTIGAGAGIGFMVGGPVGGAIGAGIGLIASLF